MSNSAITTQICQCLISNLNKWKIEYIDGCGYKNNDLYDIFWNLLLIVHNIRPTFMIQQIDYAKNNRIHMVNIIITNLLSLKFNNNNIFELTYINQGILVYLSKNISDEKIYDFIQKGIIIYNNNNDSVSLGNLLGYPCSGDIDISMSNKNRGNITLYINKTSCIMSNICDFSNEKIAFKKINKFEDIKKKLYEIKNEYSELKCYQHEFTISINI